MKTSERFNRAIHALVDAYFNETLVKGSCHACAVGNMVASSIGVKVKIYDIGDDEERKNLIPTWSGTDDRPEWDAVFMTPRLRLGANLKGQIINPKKYKGKSKRQILSTGYSWQELARIENAFETNTNIYYDKYHRHSNEEIEKDQYNGLMAVVDVLCEIEGITDVDEINSYKSKFEKVC